MDTDVLPTFGTYVHLYNCGPSGEVVTGICVRTPSNRACGVPDRRETKTLLLQVTLKQSVIMSTIIKSSLQDLAGGDEGSLPGVA